MLKTVYIKERINTTGRKVTGYTCLTDLLRSEDMIHIYRSAWLILRHGNTFNFSNLLIYKINLNHGKQKRGNTNRADS